MNATELTTLSMSELKAICVSQSIEVVGDKRSKATWISAIETFQSQQTVIEIIETLPTIPDPLAERSTTPLDPYMEIDGSTSNITPTPKQHGAAIVILAPLILLSLAIISVRIGIRALIPLIAAVGRLLVSIGRSITGTDRGTDSIPILRNFANDYFPA
jgi:hypothetical protein